jgi:hypothetical protein
LCGRAGGKADCRQTYGKKTEMKLFH